MNNTPNNKSNGVWMSQSVSTNRYFLTWACRGRPPSPGRASPGNTSVSLITGEVQDHPPVDTHSRCSLVSSDDPRRFVLVSRRLASDGTTLIFLLFILLAQVLGWRCLQQCSGEPRRQTSTPILIIILFIAGTLFWFILLLYGQSPVLVLSSVLVSHDAGPQFLYYSIFGWLIFVLMVYGSSVIFCPGFGYVVRRGRWRTNLRDESQHHSHTPIP